MRYEITITKQVTVTVTAENTAHADKMGELLTEKLNYDDYSCKSLDKYDEIQGIDLTAINLLDEFETEVKELPVTIIKNTLGHE